MMKYDISFNVGINQQALSMGHIIPIKVDMSKTPHLVLAAPSGSGKTYALKFILKQLSEKNGIIFLCDFKGIDFIEMQGCERYYKHQDVGKGIKEVYDILQKRMNKPQIDNNPIYFVCDEWSGFILSLEKKKQEEYKQYLAAILMLGRGANVFVILAMQRFDSTNFTSGSRDNFGSIMGLGRLSKEAVRMLFAEEAEEIKPKSRGKGYLRSEGQPLTEFVIPRIRDMAATDSIIKHALSDKAKGGD